jgi:catechol 2,3-dioxygenase-like lactoylglutathione lyase family enzyme
MTMPRVQRLQHTSVPMPPGSEEDARRFYGLILNMEEKPVPESLKHLGLVWLKAGDDEIHVFSEENFGNASVEQHFCLHVDDIDWYRQRLVRYDVPIEETISVPNRPRFFVRDPFGNKIEMTEVRGDYT